MRRILQSQGCEVIHLGHNRSVADVVDAAVQEDVQGVAVSSYQGGHIEYFEYLVESLRERGAAHVQVVGGGVIVRDEIDRLRESGVTIFAPEDGQRMGLAGMISSVVADCDRDLWEVRPVGADEVISGDHAAIARAITGAETGRLGAEMIERLRHAAAQHATPVLGITGTGGSGKSSLTDELVRRLRLDQQDKLRVAVLAVDPTRRKGGGALLGDRIRMNALDGDRVYFRSLATRGARELPEHLDDVLTILKAAGFDLVVVETPGIGQGDAAIVPFADTSLYVMTPEFGAASQLEKIDMLDFADVVAINKFERRGAKDALRDVGRQLVRNREAFGSQPDQMPVFGTSAATFNDDGVTALYQELRGLLAGHGLAVADGVLPRVEVRHSSGIRAVVPTYRVRYLAEITETVRGYHAETDRLAAAARRLQQVEAVTEALGEGDQGDVPQLLEKCHREVPPELRDQIVAWPDVVASYSGDEQVVAVRDREVVTTLTRESLSGTRIPRVALPALADHGDLVRYWRRENLPGRFPFTAGVFAFKRDGEDPARMFAGEGDPGRTNRRFKVLSADGEAKRLSTAFDSVTLYGRDPDPRPDIYGKVGRHLRRLRGHARRHEDALRRVRPPLPDHLGLDDHQRPRPHRPGLLPRHRPGPGLGRTGHRRGHRPGHGARHRAGRHPQGGPGPEHVPVLHRVQPADDGRHPGVVHREPGPQLLLRLHLRLPHRRGRGEPDQPAGLHPGQRLHLRRGLPRPRHGHRRLRAEPVVLLLQRHGPGVLRHRSGRPADLGRGDAREVRNFRSRDPSRRSDRRNQSLTHDPQRRPRPEELAHRRLVSQEPLPGTLRPQTAHDQRRRARRVCRQTDGSPP